MCIMVGIDRFNCYGHAVALHNKTSKSVAKDLESYVFITVPSTPEVIFTDRCPILVPFLPHSNGGVERFNQTMKQRLMPVHA